MIRRGGLVLGSLALFLSAHGQTPATGTISGEVLNTDTQALLEGAIVQLGDASNVTTTLRGGSFTFTRVTPGRHTLTAFYTGLTGGTSVVEVTAGGDARVVLALKGGPAVMDAYTVTALPDGNAAAITQQRNALNLVHVVSMDAYGNVTDGNIGYFLQKLPGVAVKKEAGEIVGVGLRGMPPELNSVMLDGVRSSAAIAGFSPQGDRATLIDQIPSESIKEISIIKGLTPELPADSLGGAINLVTKSATDYKGRLVTLRAGFAQNIFRDTLQNKFAPNAAVTFLDAYGPGRNLGVALTASYSKTFSARDRIQGSYALANSINSQARLLDDQYDRVRSGVAAKIEYRFDRTARVWVDLSSNYFGADAERFDRSVSAINRNVADYAVVSRAAIEAGATPRTTAGAIAGIAPGFTDTLTEVFAERWNNNSNLERKRSYQRKVGVSFDKRWPEAKLTASALFNPSRYDNFLWGLDSARVAMIGLSIDSAHDLSRPRLTQTFGPSIAFGRVANYAGGRFATADYTHEEVSSVRADYERRFGAWKNPVAVKTGLNFRHQYRWNRRYTPAWDLVGPDRVQGVNPATGVSDDGLGQFLRATPGYGLFNTLYPRFDELDVYAFEKFFAASPAMFQARGTTVSYYPPKNIINETVPAGYAQAQVDFGPLNLLGGARYEATRVAAQGRLTDAFNPAELATTTKGNYSNVYPSLHARYQVRNNLVAHVSHSTGGARPRINQIIPTTTINYTANNIAVGSVTQGNPALKPQYSRNYDVSVEYYLEPSGVISAGWFHKDIKDFITTVSPSPIIGPGANNGFNGRYEGFAFVTTTNLNSATVDGWEFNYMQRFTFLPAAFKGLGAYGNYTRLLTKGSTVVPPAPNTVPNTQLTDFTPMTYNLGLTYDSSRFGARLEYHYKSRFKTGNNPNPLLVSYSSPDATVDVNFSYKVRRGVSVYVDFVNIFNESPYTYIGNTNRRQVMEVYGARLNFGFNGRF